MTYLSVHQGRIMIGISQLLSLGAVLLLLALLSAQNADAQGAAANAPAAVNGAAKARNAAAPAAAGGGDWKSGRVTYYGAPESYAKAYDPSRGEGSFGILAYGSCGYTNADGQFAFDREEAAASADASEDYPGSCGRCYEIKCDDSTPVQDNSGNPIQITNGFYEGDKWRPYLPAINANVTDTQGREYQGSAKEDLPSLTAVCHKDAATHKIRIVDSCPCQQKLKAGAPGVTEDTTRTQQWCCESKATHFDISYYAFEKLAHPLNGVMMIKYRTIDCDTGAAAPTGYIDKNMIYSGGPRAGWSWFQYKTADYKVVSEVKSVSGEAATCLKFSEGGGLQFKCRECYRSSTFQPFAGATAITFNIKANGEATPAPGLKMILQKAETGNYCGAEPTTGAITTDWMKVTVPIAAFECGIGLEQLTQFEFQNPTGGDVPVCIADIAIER